MRCYNIYWCILMLAIANLHSLQQSRALANELLQHALMHINAGSSESALLTTVEGVSEWVVEPCHHLKMKGGCSRES